MIHCRRLCGRYVGDELAAAAHYFRALAVAQPFVVARDNLLLLFEQNRIRCGHGFYCPTVFNLFKNPLAHLQTRASASSARASRADKQCSAVAGFSGI